MEKRYQVFVSSTFRDLVNERQEVMQALLELDCIPAGMELFPAADDDQWTLIKRVIDDCDYYIVVVAGRYGSIGPDGKSYTQMEYEYAVDSGKPVIAFLHKDPSTLPASACEDEPELREKLGEFRELTQKKMVRFWVNAQDLGSVVSRSLIKLIKTNPAIGWVKADNVPDRSASEEMLDLRKQIERLESELQKARTTAPAGTESFSQGSDVVELGFSFTVQKQGKYGWVHDASYRHSFEVTWNKLFSFVSPTLLDECSDEQLKQSLDEFVQHANYESLAKVDILKDKRLLNFELDEQAYSTVKVQLLALGLIAKGKKRRSVQDSSSYWCLESYGESVMLKLRAIRKPGYEDEEAEPLLSNKPMEPTE